MELPEQDRTDINDLINLHGHLTDAGKLDEAGELFTPDVTYDLSDFGLGSLQGTAAVREAALALGDANPVRVRSWSVSARPLSASPPMT
jgi:hypothetical protein